MESKEMIIGNAMEQVCELNVALRGCDEREECFDCDGCQFYRSGICYAEDVAIRALKALRSSMEILVKRYNANPRIVFFDATGEFGFETNKKTGD